MEKNIFENAYFGKAYKTRDGRKAIYNYHSSGGYHDIIIDEEGMSYHFADHTNGILRLPHPSEIEPDVDYSCPIDIVSEWQDVIDDNNLNEIAYEELDVSKEDMEEFDACLWTSDDYIDAFKAGYRKALIK